MPYFYDTYSILEYMSGNRRYSPYFEEDYGFLTVLNLMEIYYALLKGHSEEAADEGFSASSKFLCDFDDADIKEAMKLRLNLRNRGLDISYADALGYQLSMKLKVKFLTGDRVFKGLENVEYVR